MKVGIIMFFLLAFHGCESHGGSDNPIRSFWMGDIWVSSTSSEANLCAQSVSEGTPKCNGETLVLLNLGSEEVTMIFSSADGSEEIIFLQKGGEIGDEIVLLIPSTWVAVRVEG